MSVDVGGEQFDPCRAAVAGRLARRCLHGPASQDVDGFRLLRRADRRPSLVVGSPEAVGAGEIARQVVLTKVDLDALLGRAPISAVLPRRCSSS